MWQKICKSLAYHKLVIERGRNILGTVGFGYLIASQLQDHIYEYWGWSVSIIHMFVVGGVGLWVAGWLQYITGFWQAEQKRNWTINPAFTEMIESLKRIERKLDK